MSFLANIHSSGKTTNCALVHGSTKRKLYLAVEEEMTHWETKTGINYPGAPR